MQDFEYYLKINVSEKKILDVLEELNENFGNINGLDSLEQYKIEDLSFLGYNIGFIKIVPKCRSRINQYHCSNEILENFKDKLRKKLENKKTFYLERGVKINNQYFIKLNQSEQILLTMKYLYCIDNKNSVIDYYTSSFSEINITSKDFILLYEKIINYIDQISKFMVDKMQKINNADNLIDLFLLDLNDIDLNGDITL
jgi:hypothetical protein